MVPPGYKDDDKKNKHGGDNNKHGDYIIWRQIIDYAKEEEKNIIFITHDQKEDWWNIVHGKTVGPRIEIRKEFSEKTSQKFHMYSMNSFIERFNINIDQSVVDELSYIGQILSQQKMQNVVPDVGKILNKIYVLENSIYRKEKVVNDLRLKYEGKKIPEVVRIQIDNTIRKTHVKKQQLMKKQEQLHQIEINRDTIRIS